MMLLIMGEKISNNRKYASNPGSLSFFLVKSTTIICVIILIANIARTHGQRKRNDNRMFSRFFYNDLNFNIYYYKYCPDN
jgi:hypothetical protein